MQDLVGFKSKTKKELLQRLLRQINMLIYKINSYMFIQFNCAIFLYTIYIVNAHYMFLYDFSSHSFCTNYIAMYFCPDKRLSSSLFYIRLIDNFVHSCSKIYPIEVYRPIGFICHSWFTFDPV